MRLLAASHCLGAVRSDSSDVRLLCVCLRVCVSGVWEWRTVSALWWGGMASLNESARSEGLSLMAANFTWQCWAAAASGLATNQHTSVSIRGRCPLSGAWTLTQTNTPLNTGSGGLLSHRSSPRWAPDPDLKDGFSGSSFTGPPGAKYRLDTVVTPEGAEDISLETQRSGPPLLPLKLKLLMTSP